MSNTPQNLKNHAKFDPPWHFVLLPIALINVIVAIVYLVRHFTLQSAWLLILSLAFFLVVALLRRNPLKVQDRVIRLEERLRLQALAPAAFHPQIPRLTEAQLIALRFASDDEVVLLAQEALNENLTRKQIKERIRTWRSDDWRV
jgi:hypothetical protein